MCRIRPHHANDTVTCIRSYPICLMYLFAVTANALDPSMASNFGEAVSDLPRFFRGTAFNDRVEDFRRLVSGPAGSGQCKSVHRHF
jgi:hypothetical protein